MTHYHVVSKGEPLSVINLRPTHLSAKMRIDFIRAARGQSLSVLIYDRSAAAKRKQCDIYGHCVVSLHRRNLWWEQEFCPCVVTSSPGYRVWPDEVLLQRTDELPGWRRLSVPWWASPAQIETQWVRDSGIGEAKGTEARCIWKDDLTLLAPTMKLWATLAMKPSTWTPRSLHEFRGKGQIGQQQQ